MWFSYKQRLQGLGCSTKNPTCTNEGSNRVSRVYVVLPRIILVQIATSESILFYKESFYYKQRLHVLCGSTKNPTDANRNSGGYVVLQRMIMVQMEAPVPMWLYKESPWYKQRLHGLCGSTKNYTGTNGGCSVMWFYKESYWYKWRLQCLGYSTKNHTCTNDSSSVDVVLQKIILVQIETPKFRLFYKESYWYK